MDFALMGCLVSAQFYFLGDTTLRILFGIYICLFFLLIYKDHWLFFIRFKPLLWIGTISYPIYLLHENIGLMLVNNISKLIGVEEIDKYSPLMAVAIVLFGSDLIYRFIEVPAMTLLRSRFSFPKVSSREVVVKNK
jgi:peptidoglycan/LPS O-acetylase OafA/YrhL